MSDWIENAGEWIEGAAEWTDTPNAPGRAAIARMRAGLVAQHKSKTAKRRSKKKDDKNAPRHEA